MTFRENQQPTTIIIKNNMSNAAGIASFIFGLISIFFMAPLFVPLAILMGIIAIISRQLIWGTMGVLCALIGFLTSPILMGIFGIVSVDSLLSNHHNAVQHQATYTAPAPQTEYLLKPQTITTPQQKAERLKQANREATEAITECKNKRLSGELKTHVESVNCSNPKFIEAYQRANYPYMDLIGLFTAKRMEVAEKTDSHELTEVDANLELAKFFSQIVDTERRRNLQGGN